MSQPVYIVMGVSGVGKTTFGKALAKHLGIPFYDGDDFHSKTNKAKMANGLALTDEDRLPWLETIEIDIHKQVKGAVYACSALKKSYRDILSNNNSIKFLYLKASFDSVKTRLESRVDHFFDPALLQSQFDTLEEPSNTFILNAEKNIGDLLNEFDYLSNMSEFGLIGLGVMGKSLARNLARNGVKLSLYNRHVAGKEEKVATQFIDEFDELIDARGFEDMATFISSLSLPRKVFIMVNAGPAVDAVINSLQPYLDSGDILMDGGNSHYKDTQRRFDSLLQKGIHFMGVGVSGGEKGALEGPSIMPGGSEEVYNIVSDYLEKIAARDRNSNACCTHVGKGGSGHFVKMIHNGIEYAEMQLIAEVYDFLKTALDYTNSEIADIFQEWNAGELESYLLGISANILSKTEGDHYLIDLILDKAKQKGTGGWSTTAALELGSSLDTISQAVMARIISSQKKVREVVNVAYAISRKHRNSKIKLETIKAAYNAARIINHGIGLETLKNASQTYDWDLNLPEIIRIWTNGCIIRSHLMESLESVTKDSGRSIFLSNQIKSELIVGMDALIEFNNQALNCRLAIPVCSAAINYFLALTREDSAANMIQAQRDYFGAHTYERIDKSGHFHTHWEQS